jgi:hypothetical protein
LLRLLQALQTSLELRNLGVCGHLQASVVSLMASHSTAHSEKTRAFCTIQS